MAEAELIPLFLRVGANGTEPIIEIRVQITNLDLIKALVSAAHHNQPLSFLPQFRDRLRALASLQEKGLIGKFDNDSGEIEYRFLI